MAIKMATPAFTYEMRAETFYALKQVDVNKFMKHTISC